MAEVKFNFKQLSNPTPAGLERWVKIYVTIAGIVIAWMPTNNIVSKEVQDIITPILGLTITIVLSLLPLFGIETDKRTIPTKDVVSMETPKNE